MYGIFAPWIDNALADGRFFWFDVMADSERLYYERCVSAIVAWCHQHRTLVQDVIRGAVLEGYTDVNLYPDGAMHVSAVIWRLHEELS